MGYCCKYIIFVIIQSKQRSNPHIFKTSLDCSIHSAYSIIIIFFSAGWVHGCICWPVICLLKYLINTNTGRLESSQVLHLHGRRIYMNNPYACIFIDCIYCLSYIFNTRYMRLFSADKQYPFKAFCLQCFSLLYYFFYSKGLSYRISIAFPKTAVEAVIRTVIGKIERGKENYPFTKNFFLNLARFFEYLLQNKRGFYRQKHSSIFKIQVIQRGCLGQYIINHRSTGLPDIRQYIFYFFGMNNHLRHQIKKPSKKEDGHNYNGQLSVN